MTCAEAEQLLPGYVLGAAEPAVAAAVRGHVAACRDCAAEAERLGAVVALLPLAPAEGYGPTPASTAGLHRLLDRVAAERRTRRRTRWVAVGLAAASAAAVAVLAVTAFGGDGEGAAPAAGRSPAGPAATASATDAASGVSAAVAIAPRGWGSALDLELAGVAGGQTCRLVAVAADGSRETAATWSVPVRGYADSGGVLRVSGAVGLAPGDIQRFVVETLDGHPLLTVPA